MKMNLILKYASKINLIQVQLADWGIFKLNLYFYDIIIISSAYGLRDLQVLADLGRSLANFNVPQVQVDIA